MIIHGTCNDILLFKQEEEGGPSARTCFGEVRETRFERLWPSQLLRTRAFPAQRPFGIEFSGSGFGQGVGLRVSERFRRLQGSGFRIWGFRVLAQGLDAHPSTNEESSGFRVQVLGSGLGFWVSGSGFRVQGFGSRISGLGFRVQGSGFRVQGFGFRVSGFGFRVSSSRFRVPGFGFRVQGAKAGRRTDASRLRRPMPRTRRPPSRRDTRVPARFP